MEGCSRTHMLLEFSIDYIKALRYLDLDETSSGVHWAPQYVLRWVAALERKKKSGLGITTDFFFFFLVNMAVSSNSLGNPPLDRNEPFGACPCSESLLMV